MEAAQGTDPNDIIIDAGPVVQWWGKRGYNPNIL